MDGPPGVACMDTRHPRRLLPPEQVLMRFSIIYDRPSISLARIIRQPKSFRITLNAAALTGHYALVNHPSQSPLDSRLRVALWFEQVVDKWPFFGVLLGVRQYRSDAAD